MKRLLLAVSLALCSTGAGTFVALAQSTAAAPQTFDQRLIDAAGHFEAITEQAYTKTRDELSALLAQAEQAVAGVSGNVSADGRAALDSATIALRSALAEGTPSRVAIASVEAYRALVNEVSSAHPIPKEVSLLDYVGFKIQALTQDGTVDWVEIGRTLDFADTTWNAISGTVGDVALRDKFASSLVDLRAAAKSEDKDRTLTAATAELDLVDSLEVYFSNK